jgi:hypothetical protein
LARRTAFPNSKPFEGHRARSDFRSRLLRK